MMPQPSIPSLSAVPPVWVKLDIAADDIAELRERQWALSHSVSHHPTPYHVSPDYRPMPTGGAQ